MNPRFRVRVITLLVVAHPLCATACSDPSQPQRERIPVVQLASHAATVALGDSLRLQLLPMLPPGYVPSVEWTSSNSVTATVVKAGTLIGTVHGLTPGQAVITVSGDGASDSTVVMVTEPGSGQMPW